MIGTESRARIRDWDFRGYSTQYGVHGIHTYVAAMIPKLAGQLIDDYVPCGGTILDPFCGGGAVLAEAVASDRAAIGRDVNDLAVLISRAKTTPVPSTESFLALRRVVASIEDVAPPLVSDNLAYWFKPEHLSPLDSIRIAINRVIEADSPMWSVFQVAFSATVRDVSLTYRNEIRLRRMSPSEIDKFQIDPIERFQFRATKAIEAVSQLPRNAQADIEIGDVRAINLPDKSVSGIVCSPPYGDERNGVSYSQFAKNMLMWMGHSSDTIRERKGLTLGWGSWEREQPHSHTLDAALNTITEFPSSIKEAVSFYADYQMALTEMARVTSGPVVIVIGPRVLRDTIFDNGAITIDLMRNIGVDLTDQFYRSLPTKRLPKMRKFGAAINREDILVFQS